MFIFWSWELSPARSVNGFARDEPPRLVTARCASANPSDFMYVILLAHGNLINPHNSAISAP